MYVLPRHGSYLLYRVMAGKSVSNHVPALYQTLRKEKKEESRNGICVLSDEVMGNTLVMSILTRMPGKTAAPFMSQPS